jgi:hypothetical protein
MAAGPITLTPQQFAKTPAASQPGATYSKYQAFIAARRGANAAPGAPAAAPAAMPGLLDPWTPTQITALQNKVAGAYGTPQTPAQITAAAQAQIAPIIAALTKSATDRATGASTAIKGLTDSYASDLAKENFAAPYQSGEQGQAAVDAALQQSLAGAGSSLAGDLQSRLGAINDPSVAQAASGLATRGAALGTTQLASGSSALSELIAHAAAAGEYGLKQPVIARNAGIQGVEQAQAQASNEIATGTQSTLNQLPQIVQALEASNQALRGNRAAASANEFNTLTGQNITKASLQAGLTGSLARAQATTDAATVRANATVAAAQARQAAAENAKHVAAARPSSAVTRTINDGFLYDGNGNQVLRGGQPVKVTPTGSKGVSASLMKQAANDAYLAYYGKTHTTATNQTVHDVYSLTYNDSIKKLMNQYPSLGRSAIVKLLNTWYSAGGKFPDGTPNGRPAAPAAPTIWDPSAPLPFDKLIAGG